MDKISERLKKVASFISKDSIVLDIGCDHAYLPIYLIKENISKKVYASDINEGPLSQARLNISESNLMEYIFPVLSDGLKDIEFNDFDTVTFCGMGAPLIIKMLEESKDKLFGKYVIFEANNKNEDLRKYLSLEGYEIIDEDIIFDNNFYYQIISTKYNKKPYELNSMECLYGKKNIERKSKVLNELVNFQLKILYDAKEKSDNSSLNNKINFLEGVLDEIR